MLFLAKRATWEGAMIKGLTQYCVLAGAVFCASAATAEGTELGTPAQARAMLERAISEVRNDWRGAIDKFNHNERPFRDRDLFVFCFDAGDGRLTAHESMVSLDVRSLRDTSGKPFGEQMYRSASEGQVAEVRYLWPIPGSTRVVVKAAHLTRAGDQVCGVSVYRQDVPPHAD
jgi:hypothetical protein